MGRAERDFHQLEAQIRRLLVVLEGPELERRLRHDCHFPGNVAASKEAILVFRWNGF